MTMLTLKEVITPRGCILMAQLRRVAYPSSITVSRNILDKACGQSDAVVQCQNRAPLMLPFISLSVRPFNFRLLASSPEWGITGSTTM